MRNNESKIIAWSLGISIVIIIFAAIVFSDKEFIRFIVTSTVVAAILIALQYFGVIKVDLGRFTDPLKNNARSDRV